MRKRWILSIIGLWLLLALCACGLFDAPEESEETRAKKKTERSTEAETPEERAEEEPTLAPFPYVDHVEDLPPLVGIFDDQTTGEQSSQGQSESPAHTGHPVGRPDPADGPNRHEERAARREAAWTPVEEPTQPAEDPTEEDPTGEDPSATDPSGEAPFIEDPPGMAAAVWNGVWDGVLTIRDASGIFSLMPTVEYSVQAVIYLNEEGYGTYQITNPFGFPFSSESFLAVGSCRGTTKYLVLVTMTSFGNYMELNQVVAAPGEEGTCTLYESFITSEGSASLVIVFTKAPEE